ncbi:MAG: sporulation protein YunB [Clostridia bacterium]|nr:sporulation protein YunB [Clostridia bacterium]
MRGFRRRAWVRLGAGRRNGGLLKFTVLCVIFLALLSSSVKFHRLLLDMAEAKVKYMTMQLVNETVSAAMNQKDGRFQNLIVIDKDAAGNVQSIHTDVTKLNLLRSTIADEILSRLAEENQIEVQVPLSNMLGLTVLSGIGPRISVQVIPLSELQVEFQDSFEQAGINQTKMQVMMQLHISVGIMAPTLQRTVQIDAAVPVAQAVIVGGVPESYTQIAGSEKKPADIALELHP